jgi:murein DD-endopeptidase MepM/ murein hydrolase activator NlpD
MKYIIPFKLRPIKIGQGFHGKSHRDWPEDKENFSYSIDFLLPEGTEIIASREGIVTKVKIDGEKNYNGKDSKIGEIAYQEWMNEIEIKHSDRTFASYCHLKNRGSFVKVGDKVKKGKIIGLSGNTGWSSEPHLDFSVIKKNFKGYKIKSTKIKFEDYDEPLEDKRYNKNRLIKKEQ